MFVDELRLGVRGKQRRKVQKENKAIMSLCLSSMKSKTEMENNEIILCV